MRVIAGGPVLKDVDMYNKVHAMFSIFSATESRENNYSEVVFQNVGIML